MRFASAASLSAAFKRLGRAGGGGAAGGGAAGAEIGLLLIIGGISGAGSLDPLLPPKPSLP